MKNKNLEIHVRLLRENPSQNIAPAAFEKKKYFTSSSITFKLVNESRVDIETDPKERTSSEVVKIF